MQVTRREMLTAASAIGLTAALGESPVEADDTFGDATTWTEIPDGSRGPDHFPQVSHILKGSIPNHTCDLSSRFLTEWKADGTVCKVRKLRGLYNSSDPNDPMNLMFIYAIEYQVDSSGNNVKYRMPFIGCSTPIETLDSAKHCLGQLHTDITSNSFANGQASAQFKLRTSVLTPSSLGSRLLAYIHGNAHDRFRYDQPTNKVFTMTVSR